MNMEFCKRNDAYFQNFECVIGWRRECLRDVEEQILIVLEGHQFSNRLKIPSFVRIKISAETDVYDSINSIQYVAKCFHSNFRPPLWLVRKEIGREVEQILKEIKKEKENTDLSEPSDSSGFVDGELLLFENGCIAHVLQQNRHFLRHP